MVATFRIGDARRRRRWACLLAVAITLACLGAANAASAAVDLKVMTFNIWLGGDQVSFTRVIDAIQAADADVVILQEAEGETRALAEALAWPYARPNAHVISRLPLFDAPGADPAYVLAEVTPGRFVAVANIHLTSDPYGPYAARAGKTAAQILKLERETRLPEIRPYIRTLSRVAARGTPVVIAGDFNAPSHLDWTPATVGVRPQVRFPLRWPVSAALERAGFRDSYREAHPDPVAVPGITWTHGYPYPTIKPNEAVDRIDQIHVGGPATTVDSRLVGPAGARDVEIPISPWPSDHLAVVSTLRIEPGPAPSMVSFERRGLRRGEPLEVRFHAATTADGRLENGRIAIVRTGAPARDALMTRPTNDGTDRGSVVPFGTAQLAPGVYDAVLLGRRGAELARARFWLLARDAVPRVTVGRRTYAPGETIVTSWHAAPGDRFDWIGLYKAGDPDQTNYLAFVYTGATIAGSARFDRATIGGRLEPGLYEARLMRDDGYVLLATARFRVEAAGR
jgi:endonuclease/exonuclease/phosphatase family metal-dependent hydrolase